MILLRDDIFINILQLFGINPIWTTLVLFVLQHLAVVSKINYRHNKQK